MIEYSWISGSRMIEHDRFINGKTEFTPKRQLPECGLEIDSNMTKD
jgi:hypothetical protein